MGKSKHLEVDEFIGNVCASVEFGNLVEHVYQHQINQTNFSKDEIESEYKKLLREIYENEAR